MGIIREHIDFQRKLEPKQAMDLGLVAKWMSIRKDDVLIIKRDFTTDSQNHIDDTSKYNTFKKDDSFEVNIGPEKYSDGTIGFTGYTDDSIVRSSDDKFIWGTPLEIDQRFEILQGLRESLDFERGLDPKKAMKIGKNFLQYKKGDKVKVWVPWEKRLVEVRVDEDEELDSDGKPRIKKMMSSTKPAWPVRRIWIRYNGEVRTANLAIEPDSSEQDQWILHQ